MQDTLSALIDQLVYIDNFMLNNDTPNLDADGQLSLDLAVFADESFIFADEEKPHPDEDDDGNMGRPHDQDVPAPAPDDLNNPKSQNNHKTPDSDDHLVEELAAIDKVIQENYHRRQALQALLLKKRNASSVLLASAHAETLPAQVAKHSSTSLHEQGQGHGLDHDFTPTHSGERAPLLGHLLHLGMPGAVGSNPQLKEAAAYSDPNIAAHDEARPSNMQTYLSDLPRFPVPPGAENSLKQAGLSQSQIDLLSALVAQHQSALHPKTSPEKPKPEPVSISPWPHASHQFQMAEGSSLMSTPSSEASGSTLLTNSSVGSAMLADLDKRRRNTAASARFRMKKKRKDKEMEDTIDHLTEMIKTFEMKIDDLELENKVLKSLIMERGQRDSEEELQLLKNKARLG